MKREIPQGTPVTVYVHPQPKKSLVEAYILGITLGLVGAHHFYLKRTWFGLAYLFTFGLLGVGYLVDLFRMPWLVKQANRRIERPEVPEEKNLCDTYLLWFPCGLFGLHLFYLRKPGQGILYFFTVGLLGIGFLVDLFRIPSLVKSANQNPPEPEPLKSMCTAYILGASPLGLIGIHHYYLNRPAWGILYTFTFGLLAVGWVYDWFRMPVLVQRANKIATKEEDAWRKHVDDIYILWFPLGWLGLHHFYLNRPGWGVLYFFTIGLLGIGWLVDFCRLPCLIKDFNKTYADRTLITASGNMTNPGNNGGTFVSVTTMPAGSASPPPGGVMTYDNAYYPPAYSHQNMTSYPPQNVTSYPPQYQHPGQMAYQPGPYYQNQGFQPGAMPTTGFEAAPPQPPTYEESLAPPTKTGPPEDSTKQGKP